MPTRVDISIGPVQGFVAQSRRTRDLWGSSYLLSFLSAHAIQGAQEAGGRIVQPRTETDPLCRWVAGNRAGSPPQLGSVPNHFVVEAEEDPSEVANAGLERFLDAWQQVCGAVWQRFMEHADASGNGTGEIWSRQTGGFWELTWTSGDGAQLARRKHWRSHRLPDEPGDKCTVIHGLQELSGYIRAESARDRERQDQFWRRVRGRLGRLNIREDERLSAIAFVKRLFPLVGDRALGWSVDGSRWPSTVHVAARPWLHRVIAAAPGQARQYAEAVTDKASNVLSEHLPASDGLDPAAAGGFGSLDGNFLHSEAVRRNEHLCPLDEDGDENAPPGSRDELSRLLENIYALEDVNGRRLEAPPMFYALLLADGDRLGRLVGQLGGDSVGDALSNFTGGVPDIVGGHGGVTVYAGGDDVLAMLPLDFALQCAASVAEGYRSAFPERDIGTLSAAVVFAHAREPLSEVIAEAHRLLDDVAKEGNGRNSLAVGVLKPSGLNCQWTTTWNRKSPSGDLVPALALLDNLTERIRTSSTEPGVSSSLIYRIRDSLSRLCGWESWQPGHWGQVLPGLDLRALVRAELHRSLTSTMDGAPESDADELAGHVFSLLTPSRAQSGDGAETAEAGVDALLLAKFLANPEEE